MQDDTKKADETIPNYSFACSVDFRRDTVDEIDFVNKDIDNWYQILFTLSDNTKAADDTSANYSFGNGIDFTIDTVEEITRRDERYPGEEIDFLDKDIHN